jgi:hypothetical protein
MTHQDINHRDNGGNLNRHISNIYPLYKKGAREVRHPSTGKELTLIFEHYCVIPASLNFIYALTGRVLSVRPLPPFGSITKGK